MRLFVSVNNSQIKNVRFILIFRVTQLLIINMGMDEVVSVYISVTF